MDDLVRPGAARTAHVYPVDMVRVLTFASVICIHTISTVNPLDSVPAGAAVMLLHFTREAFFFLTAFVLVHRHRYEPVRRVRFWRRRFLLVGGPYLVWSLIYSAIGLAAVPQPPEASVRTVLISLATGTAWFHLYFLLVSLQFYVLFPAFQWLLRVTRRHHGWLLAGSAVLQVPTYVMLHDPTPSPLTAQLLLYAGSFVGSYQFFLVLGGVVALHRERWQDALLAHRRGVVVALVVTALLAQGCYWWSLLRGANPMFASDVFQPAVIVWSVAVLSGLYLLGLTWAERRRGGWRSRFVHRAADRSFGVFLVHPLILWVLTAAGPTSPASHLPPFVGTAVVYVVAVASSLVIVEGLRRTPLSLLLTGKRRVRPTAAPTHQEVGGAAAARQPEAVGQGVDAKGAT